MSPKTTNQLENYFFARNEGVQIKKIVESFGVEYCLAEDLESLESQLKDFWDYDQDGGSKLLEVKTIGVDSQDYLSDYFKCFN